MKLKVNQKFAMLCKNEATTGANQELVTTQSLSNFFFFKHCCLALKNAELDGCENEGNREIYFKFMYSTLFQEDIGDDSFVVIHRNPGPDSSFPIVTLSRKHTEIY